MINKYAQALRNLYPTVHGYSMDFNLPTTQEFLNSITGWPEGQSLPTLSEVQAEVDSIELKIQNAQYKENRLVEYPSIGDQLDALWKGGAAAEAMLAKIQAVKSKYPKPE
jgi:hypothetical protein